VTASRIARELPQGRALLAGTAHSKRAQKLLLAEAESSTLYKERLARWFFLHPPTGVPQKELLGFINQKTNIRIGRLNELVGLWISEKSMSRMKAA
jgi:hypothetical protein